MKRPATIGDGRKRGERAAGIYAAPVGLKQSGFFPATMSTSAHKARFIAGPRAEPLPTKRRKSVT
jgi:hypothetical protein